MIDQRRFEDLLSAIESIESFELNNYQQFLDDKKTQDAVMFNLIILGEAANQVSQETAALFPCIPWKSMIGTRNVIVHGYDQIKLPIVWGIISQDLEFLKKEVK